MFNRQDLTFGSAGLFPSLTMAKFIWNRSSSPVVTSGPGITLIAVQRFPLVGAAAKARPMPARLAQRSVRIMKTARCFIGASWLLANGEHEPREAAAAGSRVRTNRIGCLPLAQCSGCVIHVSLLTLKCRFGF